MPTAPAAERPRSAIGLAGAAAAYLLASILLTWPIVAELRSAPFADYGDARGWAWSVWATSHPVDSARLLAAPFGIHSGDVIYYPIAGGMVELVARFVGEIAAMNLFLLLGFPLTALATYWLLDRLLADRAAAFIGGLAFGFCPAAVLHSVAGQVSLAWNGFVVLFLFALLHNRERRSAGSAFLVAAAFAATVFTALYIGYFAVYLGIAFAAWDFATRGEEHGRRIAHSYLLCAAFAVALVAPVEWKAVQEQLTQPHEAIAKAGHLRDVGQLDIYGSHLWNYLVPSIDHPVLGRFVAPFVRDRLYGSNAFEQTLYLGVVPLALVVVGVVLWLTDAFEPRLRRLFLLFGTGALGMWMLSLPAHVVDGLPGPSLFAYDFAPMFRVYARAGILVMMFVACAAAVVLAHLRTRMRPARHRVLVAVALGMLVFEFWSVPPNRARPIVVPPVYRWLAAQPGDFIVAEYPMLRFDAAAFYTYPYWQRIHGKRLVNGASPDNVPAWRLYEQVRDPSSPGAARALAAVGVRYVIVHKSMFAEGPIPGPIKRYYAPWRAAQTVDDGVVPPLPASFALCRSFGTDLVFTLDAHACAMQGHE